MINIRFNHIAKTGFVGAWLALITSCNLQKTNENPNASSDVSLSAVLYRRRGIVGFTTGINAGLISNIYTQQAAGATGDAAPFDNYTTSPGYFNSTWLSYYTNVLTNLKIIQQTATEKQLPYYSGIARVLTAFSYGTLTDIFGNIPFKESLYGNGITNPVYDNQEDIYTALQLQLDSAITDLSQPIAANLGAVPSADDVIFKGVIANWIATAYTLKARYAIHLSKINATDAAQKVLSNLYNGSTWRGIQNINTDAQVVFSSRHHQCQSFLSAEYQSPRLDWLRGIVCKFVKRE